MRLIRSTIVSADALSQLLGGKQAIGLDHVALAVDPFGSTRLSQMGPRQEERQDTYAFTCLLDLLIDQKSPCRERAVHT